VFCFLEQLGEWNSNLVIPLIEQTEGKGDKILFTKSTFQPNAPDYNYPNQHIHHGGTSRMTFKKQGEVSFSGTDPMKQNTSSRLALI